MTTTAKPTKYAEGTQVKTETTAKDLAKLFEKHGIADYDIRQRTEGVAVVFLVRGVWVRFKAIYPGISQFATRKVRGVNVKRSARQQISAYEGEIRRLWRVLHRNIGTKLILAQEMNDDQFKQEFLGYIMFPHGRDVYEQAEESVKEAYAGGAIRPRLLEG